MVVARVVYKNKRGWSTGTHAFVKSENAENIEVYAFRSARGREYAVQYLDEENTARYEDYAKKI